jgi:hypothetical protein
VLQFEVKPAKHSRKFARYAPPVGQSFRGSNFTQIARNKRRCEKARILRALCVLSSPRRHCRGPLRSSVARENRAAIKPQNVGALFTSR